MLVPVTVVVAQNIVKVSVKFDCQGQEYTREYAWNIADVLQATPAVAKQAIKDKVAIDRAAITAAQAQLQALFNAFLNQDLDLPAGG